MLEVFILFTCIFKEIILFTHKFMWIMFWDHLQTILIATLTCHFLAMFPKKIHFYYNTRTWGQIWITISIIASFIFWKQLLTFHLILLNVLCLIRNVQKRKKVKTALCGFRLISITGHAQSICWPKYSLVTACIQIRNLTFYNWPAAEVWAIFDFWFHFYSIIYKQTNEYSGMFRGKFISFFDRKRWLPHDWISKLKLINISV